MKGVIMFSVIIYFKDGHRKEFINCRVIAHFDNTTIKLTCDPLGDGSDLVHYDFDAKTIAEIKERPQNV